MTNNKVHTIIIGTSKSKNENGYYIDSKKKFWSLIYLAGITPRLLEPTEYKILTKKYGIGFSELAFDSIFLGEDSDNEAIKNDNLLNKEIEKLNIGIPKLLDYLKQTKPKRIAFNGKSAAAAFFEYVYKGKIDKLNSSYVKERNYQYGKIDSWNGIEIWMMPNLSNAAGKYWKEENGEERWLSFWKELAKEIPKKKKSFKWFFILLIIVIITSILLFNFKK
jgi:hypothetical protein